MIERFVVPVVLACAVGFVQVASGARAAGAQEVRVTPGPGYAAGPLHTRLLGRDYRDLWTTPVQVERLDLATFAGGLTPLRRGGGRQTAALRLRGGDGREYAFRSVAKVPELAAHPDLRGALLGRLIQDQASSIVPAAGLVAAPLSLAAGLPAAVPRLFVMPDDPRLGEFRGEFAGMLGTLEEHADEAEGGGPGFGGFTRIGDTDDLLEHLEEEPGSRVDERAYLRARLLDVLLGDWDRHEDQWRWAAVREGGGVRWIPVARDRDYAFSDYDGALLDLVRRAVPNAVRFREHIGPVEGLVLNAGPLDRRLLGWLERPVWEEVVAELRGAVTDAEIAAAVARLPEEHRTLRGSELERLLRARRDRLPEAAADFYRVLSRMVELHGTDAAEHVRVVRETDGALTVTVAPAGGPHGGAAAAGVAPGERRRRFDPEETREVRLFLNGGADRAVVEGTARRGLQVRVVGGGGADTLRDLSRVPGRRRWTSLHDAGPDDVLEGGDRTRMDRRPYDPPERVPRGLIRILPADFGTRSGWAPVLDYSTTTGVVVGAAAHRTVFAFRRLPHAARTSVALRFSPRWMAAGLHAATTWQSADPALSATGTLIASAVEVFRFHGLGNETPAERPASRYLVRRDRLELGAQVRLQVAPGLSAGAGPLLRASRPHPGEGSPLKTSDRPGRDGWSAAGAELSLVLDRGREAGGPRVRAVAAGSGLLPMGGVTDAFGGLRGWTSLTVPVGSGWTAARAGARRAFGAYPVEEAAFLGGRESLRGHARWRYAGDSLLHGSLEAGVHAGRLPLVLNWRAAPYAFVDAGRVFLAGESSDRWHSGAGLGLQLSALEYSLRVEIARGDADRLYLTLGVRP